MNLQGTTDLHSGVERGASGLWPVGGGSIILRIPK